MSEGKKPVVSGKVVKTAEKRKVIFRRPENSYDFRKNSGIRDDKPGDDRTLRPDGPQVSLARPNFFEGHLTFRVLPAIDAATGSLYAYRYSLQPNDFSDFIRTYPAAKGIGIDQDTRCTFFLYDTRSDDVEQLRRENPYVLLYNAIKRATGDVKQATSVPRAWDLLLKGGKGRGAALTAPTTITYLQSLIFQHGKKYYLKDGGLPRGMSEDDLPQFVQLSGGCGKALVKMFNKVKADVEDMDSTEFERDLVFGDIVDLDGGKFITVYNAEVTTFADQVAGDVVDEDDSWQNRRKQSKRNNDDDDDDSMRNKGYSIRIDPTLVTPVKTTKIKPAIDEETWNTVSKKIVPWDDKLQFLSNEVQAYLVAKAFAGVDQAKKMFRLAWADHSELLSEEVQKVLSSAKSVAVNADRAIPGEDDDDDDGDGSDTPAPVRKRSQLFSESDDDAEVETPNLKVRTTLDDDYDADVDGEEATDSEESDGSGDAFEELENELYGEEEAGEAAEEDAEDTASEEEEFEDDSEDDSEDAAVEVGESVAEEAARQAALEAANKRSALRQAAEKKVSVKAAPNVKLVKKVVKKKKSSKAA